MFGADRSRVIRCAAQQTRFAAVGIATGDRCRRFAGRVSEKNQRSTRTKAEVATNLIEPANALRLSIVFDDFSLMVRLSMSKLLQSLTSACTSRLKGDVRRSIEAKKIPRTDWTSADFRRETRRPCPVKLWYFRYFDRRLNAPHYSTNYSFRRRSSDAS